ncbi:hypothetical protein [Nitrosovibrio tenuis]|uniref:Uncharacterized protein n=1 Tax=Nitrosovibrio tenuis TaxID=1233 RepID=A0A1H7IT57_9PROT|nr:hypothetical protein [Nitrosovibrio tenuis]SEK65606.1 hypothetical protein SAMN05216387_102290 [Nitrosovibrio tenuis]
MEKILKVKEVGLAVPESFPPQLHISASGTVPTAGWSNPQLMPHVHIQAPPDGIYGFDFVAVPPEGATAQVISSIEVADVWENLPEGIKGVRIHASQNSKTILLDLSKPDRQPNRYIFTNAEGVKRVVFFPEVLGPLDEGESLAGPQLEYHGAEGQLTFHGDDISQEQTVLGTLISVALKLNMDAGGLDFALVLPPVNLGGRAHQAFETVSFKIHSKGRMARPAGPELTYEVVHLNGIAEDIPVL